MTSDSLSRRERQIMDILYRRGEASAAEIHADLPAAPTYSATRAMLSGLLRRGAIRHRREGGKYVYRPAQPRKQAASSAIKRVVDTFFDGSASEAIAGILATNRKKLSQEELQDLKKLIEKAENR